MTKIAVPTNNGNVAEHFGRCPQYTLIDIDGCDIKDEKVVENPGHRPDFLPKYLNDLDVDIVLAGGMGRRAFNLFKENNIKVVTGARGSIIDNVKAYLDNELDTENEICDHGDNHHSDRHHQK